MMRLPAVLDFEEALSACNEKWATWEDTNDLNIAEGDFAALYQPGAHQMAILTRPVPGQNESFGFYYHSYQVITEGERRVHRIGSWNDFDLDTFTVIEIPLPNPGDSRLRQVSTPATQFPGIGLFQATLKTGLPDFESYTYREIDSFTYEVDGESKTIVYEMGEKPIATIDGGSISGIDFGGLTRNHINNSIGSEWPIAKLESITLKIGDKEFTAPPAATANLFHPRAIGQAHVSPDGRTIILEMAGGDGAGSYRMRWLFVDGEFRWRRGKGAEFEWD
jgi:hypothetical protein